jgi:raffinose/stachyose/melibiose transport system permease protein
MRSDPTDSPRRHGHSTPNVLGGLGGWLWLIVVLVPVYYIVISSLKQSGTFYMSNALLPPTRPTFANYGLVFSNGFLRYVANSLIVTAGTVLPALALAFTAAYGIVRGKGRFLSAANSVFLLGLSIPLNATIIPIYYLIIRLGLYDTLLAIILPSIAFALPISVLILGNSLREVPKELFESMRLDGASEWRILISLAVPLSRPAFVTVGIFDALNVWNGFLLPLILTQDPKLRVVPQSLWAFQGQFTTNVPGVLASVVLSAAPLLAVYVLARRQLVTGLTAGVGK